MIFIVVIVTSGISIVFISPFTYGFSVISYRRGFNPDMIVYTVISIFSDIIVTICYVIRTQLCYTDRDLNIQWFNHAHANLLKT